MHFGTMALPPRKKNRQFDPAELHRPANIDDWRIGRVATMY